MVISGKSAGSLADVMREEKKHYGNFQLKEGTPRIGCPVASHNVQSCKENRAGTVELVLLLLSLHVSAF